MDSPADLNSLGYLSLLAGKIDRAQTLSEEYLALARQMNSGKETGGALRLLGHIAQQQGNAAQARSCFEEALELNT